MRSKKKMRVSNWNPEKYNGELMAASMKRLKKAAKVVKIEAKSQLNKKLGQGWGKGPKHKFNLSHGPYKTGAYPGVPWTAREAGSLMKSIRVTEKHETGTLIATFGKTRNVRIYAGNYLVWWAAIFEYYKPYMRPALNKSKSRIRDTLENG